MWDSSSFCYNELAPPKGRTRALRVGEAVTLRPISTVGKRDYRSPLGIVLCVWLLTFKQPSDQPPLYEWFGL